MAVDVAEDAAQGLRHGPARGRGRLAEDHEDGGNDGADLDPLVDPARALDDEVVAVDGDRHAALLLDFAGHEGEGAVPPEKEAVDRRLEQELVAALDVLAREQLPANELLEHLILCLAGAAGLERFDLVAGEATDPDQELEVSGQPGAGGDVGDAAVLEGDRAGVPALDQRERARLAGEADHLDEVGDEEVAEASLEVEGGCGMERGRLERIHVQAALGDGRYETDAALPHGRRRGGTACRSLVSG